jgi:hypothetical protein
MHSRYPRLLAFTVRFIAFVQALLGLSFLAAPEMTGQVLGLAPAPGWANWLFGMMAARCLGYAYGLWLAAKDPVSARPWITSMIAIQAIDWGVTLKYLATGAVTLAQVSTASFLPVLFVVALLIALPRERAKVQ